MLKVSDQAPDFCLQGDDGNLYRLNSFTNNALVLFFYPKDSTPGCTAESIDFSKLLEEFKSLSAQVVGISKDSLTSHIGFKCKYSLDLLLLSDPDLSIHRQYYAFKDSIFGKTAFMVNRSTFLIDEKGKILKCWYNVRVKNHAQTVLDTLKKIRKK
jgi:peroxiredoxin Q/BCP